VSEVKLPATARTEFGKGAARRLRRAGQIPAVLYGHGTEPVHVALPGHETMLAVKHANALFEIQVDGKPVLALAKDVQREPVKNVIEHIDLLIVKKGETVSVEIPVVVVGESAPGTIHVVETQTLALDAEATHLPTSVEIDITGLEDGASIKAGEVTLPKGSALTGDPELVIVAISTPRVSAEDLGETESDEATTEA
jgi:large subunit ribosomal protein L25